MTQQATTTIQQAANGGQQDIKFYNKLIYYIL